MILDGQTTKSEYKLNPTAGALLLIDMLYAQKKINELTYRNIQNKYNKKQVSK